jgi:hypothetical protein
MMTHVEIARLDERLDGLEERLSAIEEALRGMSEEGPDEFEALAAEFDAAVKGRKRNR